MRSAPRRFDTDRFLVAIALAGIASLTLVFTVAPTTLYGVSTPANLIAYWHIALAWTAGVALLVTFLGSVQYLRTRRRFWNLLAAGSGEVGFVMLTVAMVMGSLWGSVIWGVYWSWGDVRMVTLFIAWFVYAGYLVVFHSTKHGEGKYAAVYGVLGFLTVPLSFVSVRLWQPELHNPTLGNTGSTGSIDGGILVASILAIGLLYAGLLSLRLRLFEFEDAIVQLTGRT
jgi:heme exporter protein C